MCQEHTRAPGQENTACVSTGSTGMPQLYAGACSRPQKPLSQHLKPVLPPTRGGPMPARPGHRLTWFSVGHPSVQGSSCTEQGQHGSCTTCLSSGAQPSKCASLSKSHCSQEGEKGPVFLCGPGAFPPTRSTKSVHLGNF